MIVETGVLRENDTLEKILNADTGADFRHCLMLIQLMLILSSFWFDKCWYNLMLLVCFGLVLVE